MSGTSTAPAMPDLEHKAAATSPDVGLLDADDQTGIVEAIVSVTGVRDHDDDVIEPGAYAKSLARRTPKGIFHHDWHKWASKTLAIEEWLPGDPRLPKQTKDGKPWPAEAGALYVKTQYNLNTTQGRDAYENVKFYGPECEWSVGYRVPAGKSVRGKDGVRRIKEMDLFEYSPVLFGANSLSGTLAVKSVGGGDAVEDPAEDAVEDDVAAGDEGQAWDELDAEADAVADDDMPSPADDDMPSPAEADEDEGAPSSPEGQPGEESPAGPEDGEAKGSSASLNRSPKKNWVELAGELPAYIREIARSIHEKRGTPLERAVPIAIGTVKRWARGGDDVSAETRAKAAKAVAEWEMLRARSRARAAGKDAGEEAVESTLFPWLPGTFEELREQLRAEAVKALGVEHVEVMGTWPTHAVITAYEHDADGLPQAKAYEVPYAVHVGDGGGSAIVLEEPQPVELTVSVGDVAEEGEKLLPFPGMIEEAAAGLRAVLTHGEVKAGRVLSAVNAKRLRSVVEQLIGLLRSAGIDVDTSVEADKERNEREARAEAAQTNADSTAPSARVEAPAGKAVLDPDLVARGYRLLGEIGAR